MLYKSTRSTAEAARSRTVIFGNDFFLFFMSTYLLLLCIATVCCHCMIPVSISISICIEQNRCTFLNDYDIEFRSFLVT